MSTSPFKRARRRGLINLIEVLVCCAIFGGMLAMLVLIERMNFNTHTKSSANTDTYRMAMTCLEHVKSELRGALILAVGQDSDPTLYALDYQLPTLDAGGNLTVDNTGAIVWVPAIPLYNTLLFSSVTHALTRVRPSDTTQLAYLGNKGTMAMFLPNLTGKDLVTFVLHAENLNPNADPNSPLRSSMFDLTFSMRFPNQAD